MEMKRFKIHRNSKLLTRKFHKNINQYNSRKISRKIYQKTRDIIRNIKIKTNLNVIDFQCSNLATIVATFWIFFKLRRFVDRPKVTKKHMLSTTIIEFTLIKDHMSITRAISDKNISQIFFLKTTIKRLQYNGMDPIIFRSSSPFLVQLCGC